MNSGSFKAPNSEGIDLSVIIVNYNTFALTVSCIESVLKHTAGFKYELILVDNNSKDEQPGKFKDLFPGIYLIENKENLGFAKANNQGIKVSKGDFIILLNSDTILIENTFNIMLAFLKSHSRAGVVSPLLVSEDGSVQHSAQHFPTIQSHLLELLRIQKLSKGIAVKVSSAFMDLKTTFKTDWVWGTCFMVKREVIEKLSGSLDEHYFMYGEDLQWCWDISKLGYEIWHTNETSIVHLGGGSGMEKNGILSSRKSEFVARNHSVFYQKMFFIADKLLKADRLIIKNLKRVIRFKSNFWKES